MSSSSCILKGCDAKYINELVALSIDGTDETIIMNNISLKTMSIVNGYDIKQCIKII